MVKGGRLCGSSRSRVVMAGDRVQELGTRVCVEPARAFLDEAKTEMHVPEQTSFVGLPERGAAGQLDRAADVVQQCRGCSCPVSRQIVATPTVCSRSPPAYE